MDMASPYRYHWQGRHSFNAFVRRHWGIRLPVPPVVLELDAIGDSPSSAFRFALDLDDPTSSYIVMKDATDRPAPTHRPDRPEQ